MKIYNKNLFSNPQSRVSVYTKKNNLAGESMADTTESTEPAGTDANVDLSYNKPIDPSRKLIEISNPPQNYKGYFDSSYKNKKVLPGKNLMKIINLIYRDYCKNTLSIRTRYIESSKGSSDSSKAILVEKKSRKVL